MNCFYSRSTQVTSFAIAKVSRPICSLIVLAASRPAYEEGYPLQFVVRDTVANKASSNRPTVSERVRLAPSIMEPGLLKDPGIAYRYSSTATNPRMFILTKSLMYLIRKAIFAILLLPLQTAHNFHISVGDWFGTPLFESDRRGIALGISLLDPTTSSRIP